jgi:hypothetical protein
MLYKYILNHPITFYNIILIYLVIDFKCALIVIKQDNETLLHILTLPSLDDDATSVHSSSKCIGYQAILVTHLECPLSGAPFN